MSHYGVGPGSRPTLHLSDKRSRPPHVPRGDGGEGLASTLAHPGLVGSGSPSTAARPAGPSAHNTSFSGAFAGRKEGGGPGAALLPSLSQPPPPGPLVSCNSGPRPPPPPRPAEVLPEDSAAGLPFPLGLFHTQGRNLDSNLSPFRRLKCSRALSSGKGREGSPGTSERWARNQAWEGACWSLSPAPWCLGGHALRGHQGLIRARKHQHHGRQERARVAQV